MSAKLFETAPEGVEPIFRDVSVVGTQFRPEASEALFARLDALDAAVESLSAVIRHEGDNAHDPSAQAVDIILMENGGQTRFHIGYVPRKLAKVCHLKQSAGGRIRAYLRDLDYEPHADVPYAVRLDIYEEG